MIWLVALLTGSGNEFFEIEFGNLCCLCVVLSLGILCDAGCL